MADLEVSVTVEDLIDELQALPKTAMVYAVQYEDLELKVIGCDYVRGIVILATDQSEADE